MASSISSVDLHLDRERRALRLMERQITILFTDDRPNAFDNVTLIDHSTPRVDTGRLIAFLRFMADSLESGEAEREQIAIN